MGNGRSFRQRLMRSVLPFSLLVAAISSPCAAGLFGEPSGSATNKPPSELKVSHPNEPQTFSAPSARLPLPSEAELKAAEKEVIDAIGDSYARAKSRDAKASLASQLFKTAAETQEPAPRFVLLQDVQQLASDAGEIDLAIAARNTWFNTFQVDPARSDLWLFEKLSREARTPESSARLCGAIWASIDDAIHGDHYDIARSLSRLATAAAQKSGKADLTIRATAAAANISHAEAEYNAVGPSLAALQKNPNDSVANAAVGRFLCLSHRNWEKGLGFLAKGSDADWKAAAQADLANPQDALAQADVANRWWKLSDSQTGAAKNALMQRAAFWYQQASPELTGLTKTLADQRLDEFAALGLPTLVRGRVVNLMPLIDPVQDAVGGSWKMEGGELIVDGDNFNRLRIPYYPPAEYDFHIRFKRLKGDHDVIQLMRHSGHVFTWLMGASGNHHALFAEVNHHYNDSDNPTMRNFDSVVENDRTCDSLVQVRNGYIAAYLDGKLITRYPTDYSDLSMYDFWSLGAIGLGIGSYKDSDSFSVIEVVELSGPGRPLSHER